MKKPDWGISPFSVSACPAQRGLSAGLFKPWFSPKASNPGMASRPFPAIAAARPRPEPVAAQAVKNAEGPVSCPPDIP
jgi:hypothetical protein